MNEKKNSKIPPPRHLKKREKEEEYFKKLEAHKIQALKQKLEKEEEKKEKPLSEKAPFRARFRYLLEAVLVFLFALVLTRGLVSLKSDWLERYLHIILAGLWLYLPAFFMFRKGELLEDFALARLNFWASLKWFFLVSLLVFPGFYFVLWYGARRFLSYEFQLTIPAHLGNLLLFQFLLVSFPEEWFFRGYLQGRFNQVFGRPKKFLGAPLGWGWLFSSLLFALAHFTIHPQPEHLLVFFPALVFGWLREKTESLLAPVLFHFLANLSFIIFQISLIR